MGQDTDEELFTRYQQRTERHMKIVVAVLVVIFAVTLYVLIWGE